MAHSLSSRIGLIVVACAAFVLASLQRLLAHRSVAWISIAIGVALAAPSLTTGTSADDWLQSLIARGLHPFAGLPASRFDLFSFAGRDPANTQRLMDAGMIPWWTDPAVKLAFWRPLVAATHVLDWSLWPGSPFMMHVHNLLWFALALAAVEAVYRRFLGGWAAGLATFLYAVDDAHGPAVGWIANRNAMVAVALSMPVLLAHDRWRNHGWRAGAWVAPLLFALALAAGESSLAVVAYLGSYALCLDRDSAAGRARSLVPYLAVVVVWRIVYHALGYGTAHSGLYLDPGTDPILFLRRFPANAVFLLAAQLALPWSDFALFWPFVSAHAERVSLLVAATTVAVLALWFAPLCRRDPLARFFALGTLGALVPVCATFPSDRVLFFVGIGAMGLVARWVATVQRGWWSSVLVALLVVIHVVLAAPLLAIRSRSMMTVKRPLVRAGDSLPWDTSARRMLVLVNPPGDLFAGYSLIYRGAIGRPLPPVRWLATGQHAVTLTRLDERSLRVVREGGFADGFGEQLLRGPSSRFAPGQRIALTGITIEVTEVEPDGRPAVVRATFDRSLEDKSLYWATWEAGGFVTWTPPPVGKSVTLPPLDFLEAVFK
jgi:hypothetical protein